MKPALLVGWAATFAILSAALLAQSAPAEKPPRLRRADSFLGMHFDFHAGPNDREVGKNTTREMIERIIDLVGPDYLQIDCKGHPGYSSYPTNVGNPVPGFVGDPLRTWRDVTAARGVALFMHYSGVYELHAIKNPGWAAINADGKPNARATSFWGPYSETVLIPQLRELAGNYGVDGVWVDGDCWAAVPDYGPAAIAAFQQATGISTVPRKSGEPHWFEFLEFHREAFRRYLRTYIAEVKKTHPRFQICSNWAFTDHMPEPVSAPVDFLSGDYSPDDSVNSARIAGRYLARQSVPWDLMAWSFSRKAAAEAGQKVQKTAVQLQREAAVVLALGGGFQAYFKQKRDGSIFDEEMPVMAEVAKFCRERQAVCHHSEAMPQIAVLFSTVDQYRRSNGLFSRNLSRVRGVLLPLLERQCSVELLGEHQLTGRMREYPLIIVPECEHLAPAFRNEIASYVQAGGNLLLVGPGSAKLFEHELGISLKGVVEPMTALRLAHDGVTSEMNGRRQNFVPGRGIRTIGQLTTVKNPDASPQPAASITSHGRGKIAAIYLTAAEIYAKDRPAGLRDFVHEIVRELFPRPLVEVKGSPDVDVVVARNHGKFLIHLVNASGEHATRPIVENIAPLAPLEITIRLGTKPARITLEPGARPVPFMHERGETRLIIPPLAIYDIVTVHER
ncbi:MAG: hypothetical protein Q7S40_26480 [Opitutaceae bacterium]|nr:hypothetical protein [Opitutaceae bacterium]